MSKNKSFVKSIEAKFNVDELFFSITDHESTILSGNEVFIRISGYAKEEAIGQYHNIVRHPDMPRIIFKIIWDTIKEGKPIAGYVKNRTKNGEYYWVFAALFPLKDRYISIRIKPTGKFFAIAQEVYPVILAAEANGGMEESAKTIAPILHQLGYADYDHFMSDALLEELQLRKASVAMKTLQDVSNESMTPLSEHLRTAYMHTHTLMSEYDVWFDKINMFIQTKEMFEEKSLILREVAREIVFLSLNASVSSYKIASGGETFGILASDIRLNAKENDTLITHIDSLIHSLADSLSAIIFSFSGVRLQTEMLNYFIDELLCENCSVEHDEIGDAMETLVILVSEYSEKAKVLQLHIDKELQEVLKQLDQLEQQMMYLGYIQVYGIIEAAGYSDETVSFEEIFLQLKTLLQKTVLEIDVMQKMGRTFFAENRLLMEKSQGSVALKHLQETMSRISEGR